MTRDQWAMPKAPVGSWEREIFHAVEWVRKCGVQCECGGSCVLGPRHIGEHECIGDEPGVPGSCPA